MLYRLSVNWPTHKSRSQHWINIGRNNVRELTHWLHFTHRFSLNLFRVQCLVACKAAWGETAGWRNPFKVDYWHLPKSYVIIVPIYIFVIHTFFQLSIICSLMSLSNSILSTGELICKIVTKSSWQNSNLIWGG